MKNEWAKDAVIVGIEIHLGLLDAIRLVFGWRLRVRSATETEHLPGQIDTTEIRIHDVAPRWWPFKKKPVGMVAPSELSDAAKKEPGLLTQRRGVVSDGESKQTQFKTENSSENH